MAEIVRLSIKPREPSHLTVRPNERVHIILGHSGGGDWYEGAYEVTPRVVEQTLPTGAKRMHRDVLVHEIPYWEVANESGKTAIIGE